MRTPNTQSGYFDAFLFIACIIGIILSVLTIRTALRQDDQFRLFTSIIWIVLFGAYSIRLLYRLKRRTP